MLCPFASNCSLYLLCYLWAIIVFVLLAVCVEKLSSAVGSCPRTEAGSWNCEWTVYGWETCCHGNCYHQLQSFCIAQMLPLFGLHLAANSFSLHVKFSSWWVLTAKYFVFDFCRKQRQVCWFRRRPRGKWMKPRLLLLVQEEETRWVASVSRTDCARRAMYHLGLSLPRMARLFPWLSKWVTGF